MRFRLPNSSLLVLRPAARDWTGRRVGGGSDLRREREAGTVGALIAPGVPTKTLAPGEQLQVGAGRDLLDVVDEPFGLRRMLRVALLSFGYGRAELSGPLVPAPASFAHGWQG